MTRDDSKDFDFPPQTRQFYGRRVGHSLNAAAQARFDRVMPQLAIEGIEPVLPDGTGPDRINALNINDIFPRTAPIWLEIGFGGGEHLSATAARRPDINFIGVEPFLNGVASLARQAEEAGLENLRVHHGDARDLLDHLPDNCLDRVYLLYPDPWPKSRHANRRFMHPDNLARLARTIKPGAELRLASDIPEYIAHSHAAIQHHGGFDHQSRDEAAPWPHWQQTRYEAKAIREGRCPAYLIFTNRKSA